VSLTGQFASIDDDLTGRENLILLARLLGHSRPRARQRAGELLDAFGLAEATGRVVKQYSGGMRRRLDIAASMMITPDLLFLDEPTTGLDPRTRNQVWEMVREIVADGTTVLLTTQYLDEADQLADRIAVIDGGKVIAEGTSGALKASVGAGALRVRLLDPRQRDEARRRLARALEAPVRLGPDPAALEAQVAVLDLGDAGERVADALAELSRAGIIVNDFALGQPAPGRGLPRPDRPTHRRRQYRGGSMTASTTTPAPAAGATPSAALPARARPPRAGALSASLTFGWRALLKLQHMPEQLIDITGIPVIFTLMFTYLFGGALAGSTHQYLQFLLPGSLVMAVVLITVYSAVTLNTDITKGVFDRFRSLPIWRPAPLVGALLGDIGRYLVASAIEIALGLVMGFRPDGGVAGVLAAVALILGFAFGLSWIWISLGLVLRAPSALSNFALLIMFPLSLASNIFVDPGTMPGWLRAFVDVNPVSRLVTAVRGLLAGTATAGQIGWVLLASAALVAVFAPLAMHLYGRK
jgi:ABC-2 type transport system permease protein